MDPRTTPGSAAARENARAGGDTPLSAAPEQRATLLGLRRSALVEIVAFLGLMLALDLLFGSGNRFADFRPHPFWLVVLLIAMQYGTNEGLIAAGAATAALYVGAVPEQQLNQDLYDYLFEVSRLPIIWLFAAMLFGELRTRQLRQVERLRAALHQAEHRESVLSGAYRRLSEAKEALEIRVAGQLRTVFTLHKAARAIEKLGPGEVLIGIADLVREVLGPQKFSLYLLNGRMLEAVLNEGWTSEDGYARVFDARSPLFQEVIGNQEFLCVADALQERLLEGQGVLAGPLVSGDTGEVVGMLKIENIGFLDLHLASIENFRVLCQWIGTAFANAMRFEQAEQVSIMSADRYLLSASFYDRQLAFLRQLGRRANFDVTALKVRIDADRLTPAQRTEVARSIATAMATALRPTDLAFDHRRHGLEYAILLPATPVHNAQVAADKLVRAIEALLPEGAGDIRITTSLQPIHQSEPDAPAYRPATRAG